MWKFRGFWELVQLRLAWVFGAREAPWWIEMTLDGASGHFQLTSVR